MLHVAFVCRHGRQPIEQVLRLPSRTFELFRWALVKLIQSEPPLLG